jgi:tetratricopeptide (TPR) repeat protein
VKLCLSTRDTVGAIQAILQRATDKFILLQDVKGAGLEMELAAKYGAASRPQTFINYTIWFALKGDDHAIDSLVPNPRVVNLALHSIASSKNHDCAQAKAYYDSAARYSVPPQAKLFCLDILARCQYEVGLVDEGLSTMKLLAATSDSARVDNFARYTFLLGKFYEKKGEKKPAIENYDKFLNMWKNADKDLPDIIDAKARLAKLKGNAC